jgi:hypothetical protein
MMAAFMQRQQERMAALPDSMQQQRRGPMGERQQFGDRPQPDDIARIWYLDDSGVPNVVAVRTGATDGLMTEISIAKRPGRPGPSTSLTAGMQVITGTTSTSSSSSTKTTSNTSSPRGRRMGPPGLF